jgi:hypothetical protein
MVDAIPREIAIQNLGALSDRPLVISCQPEIYDILYEAVFNPHLRSASRPQLQAWIIAGEKTVALSIACLWAVEDLDRELGGGFIKSRMIRDVNHFVSVLSAYRNS